MSRKLECYENLTRITDPLHGDLYIYIYIYIWKMYM